jgi:hypothetical protein
MARLADWGRDDLPAPPPFNVRNMFRMIGPGAILLAASIGGGEWMVGPNISVKYGVGILWIATVGIVLQVMLNLEAIRYTLYTGEPALSGIMRLRPSATFWACFYVFATVAQLGIPALAKGSAQVVYTALYGVAAADKEPTLLIITYAIMAGTILMLMFGGTIERMLEIASWAMIVYIFLFLIFVNVCYVPVAHSWETFKGFLSFGYIPRDAGGKIPADIDLLLLASLAATAGSGGIGNLSISNWIRDKGFGMGGKVGAIPSVFGGTQITLSHVGKVFPITTENLSRWRSWWQYVVADQVWLWALGCFLGMYLNVNMATAIVPEGTKLANEEVGVFQAQYLAEHYWRALWILGLLNGFWILFSTHLGNTDIMVRTVTDVLWVSNAGSRWLKNLSAGKLYYVLLFAFSAYGAIVMPLGSAIGLFKVLAAIAGMVLVPAALQMLIINTTMLPPELRPAWWRRIGLALCAAFYAIVSIVTMVDVLKKTMGW